MSVSPATRVRVIGKPGIFDCNVALFLQPFPPLIESVSTAIIWTFAPIHDLCPSQVMIAPLYVASMIIAALTALLRVSGGFASGSPTVRDTNNDVMYEGLFRIDVKISLIFPYGEDTGGESRFSTSR